tara:strand:+ start:73327 stop:73644 length:318 start_codon:yes stop_codon:yes gene_type:complete
MITKTVKITLEGELKNQYHGGKINSFAYDEISAFLYKVGIQDQTTESEIVVEDGYYLAEFKKVKYVIQTLKGIVTTGYSVINHFIITNPRFSSSSGWTIIQKLDI